MSGGPWSRGVGSGRSGGLWSMGSQVVHGVGVR